MSFDAYLTNSNKLHWHADIGQLTVPTPQPLFFFPGAYKVALMGISIDNTIINLRETTFFFQKDKQARIKYSIPESHVDSILNLLEHLRAADQNIHFSILNGRIHADLPEGVQLILSKSLQRITGFPKIIRDGVESGGYDLYADCCPIMVAASFGERQIVNQQYLNVLRVLPPSIKNVTWNKTYPESFEHPTFVPVTALELAEISLQLLTPLGVPVKFASSAGIVTFHLKFAERRSLL